MKKNTFKYTFYLGLVVILGLTILLTALSFNIYKSISGKISVKEEENVVEVSLPPIKEIIHDTIFLEKQVPKIADTPKKIKESTVVTSKKVTDTFFNDSIIK